MVGARHAQFRRAFLPFPWPHLYDLWSPKADHPEALWILDTIPADTATESHNSILGLGKEKLVCFPGNQCDNCWGKKEAALHLAVVLASR